MKTFVMGCMFAVMAAVVLIGYQKWRNKVSDHLLKQAAWIGFFVTVFIGSALLSPVADKTNLKWVFLDSAVVLLFDTLLLGIFRERGYFRKNLRTLGKNAAQEIWKHHRAFLFVLLILFVQRVWMIGSMQRWDAGEYYYRLGTACKNFDFSVGSYLEHFRLCKHPTLGLALLTAPGEFLGFRGAVGVMIINLIMTLGAAYCLYRLFLRYFGTMTEKMAAWSTVLCFSLPLVWGTFSYYNPDYFIAIFFVFFLYALYRKQYLMMAFWGIMVTQCKETGLIVIFGFAFVRVLTQIFTANGSLGKRIRGCIGDLANWGLLMVGLSYIGYAVLTGGLTAWTETSETANTTFTWSNTGYNCFGFQPVYILEKFKQLFVMNYAWILWLGILLLFVGVILCRRKGTVPQIAWGNLAGVLGAMGIYLLFSCLYVTNCIYRYNVLFVLFTAVLFCVLFGEMFERFHKRIPEAVFAVLLLLMSVQTFTTTDPVSNALIRTVSTGNNRMLYSAYQSEYFGDYFVYNYQYTWLDKAYDALFEAIAYDEDTQIIVVGTEWEGTHVNGNGQTYVVNWDTKKKERTFRENANTIPISVIAAEWVPTCAADPKSAYGALSEKAAVIFIPYYEEEEASTMAMLSGYYAVGERGVVSVRDGEIVYYPLTVLQ